MSSLPINLKLIDKLKGKNGIKQGITWIKNYHEILNPNKKKIGARWYIPSHLDGLLTIKKLLIFLFKFHDIFIGLEKSDYFTLNKKKPNENTKKIKKTNISEEYNLNNKLIEKLKKLSNAYEVEKLNHQITKIELQKYKSKISPNLFSNLDNSQENNLIRSKICV